MIDPSDDRSAMVKAMAWTSRVMAISVEMVLPGVLGLWLDNRLGTRAVLTLLGFTAGLTLAIWHLVKMTDATRK